MDLISIDGLDEEEFRRSIESMLRVGETDAAATKLRALLEPFAGEGRILPARFRTASSRDIVLGGWDDLARRIRQYDRPNHHISAVSLTVAAPEDGKAKPGAGGGISPSVETNFYSDDAYPFSDATRDDLLDGYSNYGSEWQGNFEQTDTTLTVGGIDDLFGAIAALEARLVNSSNPGADEICAGSLGACYLAVLVHQAIRDKIRSDGLPRALCVFAGDNGVYPFFDAPVVSFEECVELGIVSPVADSESAAGQAATASGAGAASGGSDSYSSLLGLGIRKDKKAPVLVLDPAEAEAASRHYELGAAHHMAENRKSSEIGVFAEVEAEEAPPAVEAVAFAGDSKAVRVDDDWNGTGDPESLDFDDEQDLSAWLNPAAQERDAGENELAALPVPGEGSAQFTPLFEDATPQFPSIYDIDYEADRQLAAGGLAEQSAGPGRFRLPGGR